MSKGRDFLFTFIPHRASISRMKKPRGRPRKTPGRVRYVRVPEHLDQLLRAEAALRKTSLSAIVLEALAVKYGP